MFIGPLAKDKKRTNLEKHRDHLAFEAAHVRHTPVAQSVDAESVFAVVLHVPIAPKGWSLDRTSAP